MGWSGIGGLGLWQVSSWRQRLGRQQILREVLFQDENFRVTQKALAGLFNVKVPGVSKHLKNFFESGELVTESVVSILETTAADGKIYKTKYYNLDIHHRRSIRLKGYDYSQAGAYFVTICTQNRECLFGENDIE